MSPLHRDQEYHMNMTRKAWHVPVLAAAAVCWGSTLAAQDKDEQEGNQAAVAKAVLSARVSLDQGLAASASHGQPISAKLEIGEGRARHRRLSRGQHHTVVKGWPPRRRRDARKGRRAQDSFGAVVTTAAVRDRNRRPPDDLSGGRVACFETSHPLVAYLPLTSDRTRSATEGT